MNRMTTSTLRIFNAIVFVGVLLSSVSKLSAQTWTVGTGTASNTSTGYPTPYGNYYAGMHAQFMYTAAQCLAAGMTAGQIHKVAFNITNTNGSQPLQNYNIYMKGTTATSLASMQTGLTLVYSGGTITPATGWNTYTLTTTFTWNGTDNIVVDVCSWNGANNYTSNCSAQWTTALGGTYSNWYRADTGGPFCTQTSSSGTSTTRPNIQFTRNNNCTGTPTTTASGPANVCPNSAFTLTSTPITGAGVTYQWKSATALVGPYSNIVGATSASYTVAAGIATTMYYQVVATCSFSLTSYTSNNVTVDVLPTYVCSLCASNATSTADEDIFNVTLGTLNNSSACSQTYSDYRQTVAPPTLTAGSPYTLSVNWNTCGGYYGRTGAVYIDYNHNGVFTDAGENVWTISNPTAVVSTTITIPGNALPGIGAMRVVYAEQGTAPPCGTYTWGETEDYIVNVFAPPCTGTPSTTASGPANVCPNTAFTLSCTAVSGTGVSYQWKSASALAGPYANIVGATNPSYTVAAGINTTTYYQVFTICSASGQNYTSNNVTVNVLPTHVCNTCISTATSTADEDIFNVSVGTLNNSSSCSQMYTNFMLTVPAPTLMTGSAYLYSVNFGTCGGFYGRTGAVYIDYNQNGLYTDVGEDVWTVTNPTNVTSTTITIPATATFGITSMRVVYAEQATAPPCGTYTWGETEDYIVSLAGISCTVTGSPFCQGGTVNVNYTAGGILFNAGNVFTAQLSNAAGSFLSPTNIGTLTSIGNSGTIVCTIPAAQPPGSLYRIRVISSNAAVTGSANGTDLTINPTLVPTANITVSPGTTICAGDNITFTASPTNGGPSPSYQWYVGATPVGTNSATYSTTTLANGNSVSCVMTSNAPCATPATATSNSIVMTVNPLLTPTISVSSVPLATDVCVGQTVTFTAVSTNGGPGPVYQWYKNGNPVGTNSTTYVDNLLTNNDNITCAITSNATCLTVATVTSAPLVITVNPPVTPGVTISASPGNTICVGDNTTFTATIANGGPNPVYQWFNGATPIGTNNPTYSSATLATGNVITCVITSNALCAAPTGATSNAITMTVNPVVTPTINLAVNPGNTICAGTNTTFTASITNGGPTPTYQWTINGNPAGSNSSTLTSNTLSNGDTVTCNMISSANCPTPASVSSTVVMTVNPVVVPGVTASIAPGTTICSGTLTTFTATGTNGGPTPAYQWYKNGIPIATGAIYTSSTLVNNDMISVTMTSSATCPVPASVTSSNITMLVNPTVNPTVSVSNNTGNTICAGTNVTFVVSTVNGGNAPIYQWYLNGNPVGGNSPSYMNGTLVNGDVIYCSMTSNAVCPSPAVVNSATTTMTVNPLAYASVSITATPGDTICAGTVTVFDAFPTNGGPTPVYQWYLNGVPIATGPTYTTSTLNNTDVVNCKMTSNATCATPAINLSNNIMMIVTGNITPTVIISGNPVVCDESLATFNAQITNGGNGPVYQWKVNGNPVGGNSPVYTDNTLSNGDVVSVDMTSGFVCSTPPTVTATMTMTVNPLVIPSVNVTSTGDTICHGGTITFTATPVNGGPTPIYQWMKNNGPIGGPTSTFTYNNFVDGDVVSCNLVSSEPCPLPAIAPSNNSTVLVNPWMTPKVYLNADPSTLMCSGAPVVFNATVDSAGDPGTLSYQWMLNGNPVGNNSPSWQGQMLNNGDMVNYIMTSTTPCLTQAVDTSATDTVAWFNSGYLAGVPGTTETNTINLSNQNTNIRVGHIDCDLISSIKPSGANPVSGPATFKVTLDNEIQNFGGQPYIQRHYDIEPQNNAATATAMIELYAYENEFIAYNNHIQSTAMYFPALPTNKVDNGNVRITIFHGTGTAPGNYTGPTEEISPVVTWNIADNWWVMTFPATGFSGYYIHTGEALAVSNTAGMNGFSMEAYPNPVKDKVEVKLTGNKSSNSSLVLTDLTGRTLINVSTDNNKAIIDMSGLASGMYMLRYADDTRSQVLKITKQ